MELELQSKGKKRVAYFYNPEISKYTYAKDHPMKPERIAMTHSLINSFNIYRHLDVYMARQASKQEMTKFHTPDYISYLEKYITKESQERLGLNFLKPETGLSKVQQEMNDESKSMKKRQLFKVGESPDCPAFPGLFNFCMLSSGASIDCATAIINNKADIAINWGGGLHHAKKCQSSGFCYVNDIVLAILQLLQVYQRVLYIDIDVHHGDGVEEAFFLTNRVMTLSFHQFGGDFFPGTGFYTEVGAKQGTNYSLNVPMKKGMDDDSYFDVFKDVTNRVIDHYRPNVIVFQLGADSLSQDKLGRFNLSIKGHGACLQHIISKGIRLIMLGGGGYTIHNVSKCWAYQTGLAVGMRIDQEIPSGDSFFAKYENKKLHFPIRTTYNENSKKDLDDYKNRIYEILRGKDINPNVNMGEAPKRQMEMDLEQ